MCPEVLINKFAKYIARVQGGPEMAEVNYGLS